jgi:hypothetical protein
MKLLILILITTFVTSTYAQTQTRTAARTQEVNFDGSEVDGKIRTPDGAYLNPQKGVRFMPLYKVDHQFDREIKSSVEFLR